jgi:hypothetical protein
MAECEGIAKPEAVCNLGQGAICLREHLFGAFDPKLLPKVRQGYAQMTVNKFGAVFL